MSTEKKLIRKEVTAFKIVLVGIYLMAMLSFIAPPAKASTLGIWETHRYTRTIAVGNGYFHQYRHEGAISGSSHLISSNGRVSLTYQWNPPWLFTSIVNLESYPVTVTWEEDFYVV